MDLHPNEIRILKVLKEKSSTDEIAKAAQLDPDAVNRTISWLSTKGLVKLDEKVLEEVALGEEGRAYAEKGLPERRIVQLIGDGGNISNLSGRLDREEISIGLGWLRKKNLARMEDKGQIAVLNKGETEDERLLALLRDKNRVETSDLTPEQKKALDLLKSRRNVVDVLERKRVLVHPTEEGIRIGETMEVEEKISQLTPQIIRSGSWKQGSFRPYDHRIFVKPEYAAKKHPLRRLIDRISDIFIAMGFKEIKGPLIESAFWNFDALFVPQDHPARDMQDTFYLENPEEIEIPLLDEFKDRVKETHEKGWTTGSTGWGYQWSGEHCKPPLLRTHTTAVTCKYLTSLSKGDLPAKVFCIGKTFRNEAIDFKHLPEFYQVEGIVVDENANFRNLLGILDEFYREMGFKVRFRPSYYPYTEMSVDPEVYMEGKGWIELGGSGIFRPEVVKPLLGFECPVLAWGLGLDRVVALSLGLEDIRDLYISDLDWLRKSRVF
ncbi:MAG: phenylalanine--tRNA ligase subunit alpha [Candidatus Altiarchaeota archaeon]|nr:phenylalanine--tRNA ligase subunit alpha [Candidatus Altiarchaeota archaeon]